MATIRKGCGCVRPYSPGVRKVSSRKTTSSITIRSGSCQTCKKKTSKNGG